MQRFMLRPLAPRSGPGKDREVFHRKLDLEKEVSRLTGVVAGFQAKPYVRSTSFILNQAKRQGDLREAQDALAAMNRGFTDAQIRQYAARTINVDPADASFDPQHRDELCAQIIVTLDLKVWHADGCAFAEAGHIDDRSQPFVRYMARYSEYGGDRDAAERRAVAHTAARLGEELAAPDIAPSTPRTDDGTTDNDLSM